jgi:hypothetical protein
MFRALLVLAFLFGSKVGSHWDPDGLNVQNEDDVGSHWDPNG